MGFWLIALFSFGCFVLFVLYLLLLFCPSCSQLFYFRFAPLELAPILVLVCLLCLEEEIERFIGVIPGLMSSTLGSVVFIDGSDISARLFGILFNSSSIIFNLSICCIPGVFLAPFNAQVRSLIALATVSTGVRVACVMYLCLKNTV